MKKNPSLEMVESISALSYEIRQYYGNAFNNFNGSLDPFKGLDKLIENHIPIYYALPYRISVLKNEITNKIEREMIFRAQNILENEKYFCIFQIISETDLNYRKFKTILDLIEKRIFISETLGEGKKIFKK